MNKRERLREYRATGEHRMWCVERLVHGLDMTPVAWSPELARFVEVPAAEAFQVLCRCGNRYRFNSRQRIIRHHVEEHGLTYAEALDGQGGGQWVRDRFEEFMAESRALHERVRS